MYDGSFFYRQRDNAFFPVTGAPLVINSIFFILGVGVCGFLFWGFPIDSEVYSVFHIHMADPFAISDSPVRLEQIHVLLILFFSTSSLAFLLIPVSFFLRGFALCASSFFFSYMSGWNWQNLVIFLFPSLLSLLAAFSLSYGLDLSNDRVFNRLFPGISIHRFFVSCILLIVAAVFRQLMISFFTI